MRPRRRRRKTRRPAPVFRQAGGGGLLAAANELEAGRGDAVHVAYGRFDGRGRGAVCRGVCRAAAELVHHLLEPGAGHAGRAVDRVVRLLHRVIAAIPLADLDELVEAADGVFQMGDDRVAIGLRVGQQPAGGADFDAHVADGPQLRINGAGKADLAAQRSQPPDRNASRGGQPRDEQEVVQKKPALQCQPFHGAPR